MGTTTDPDDPRLTHGADSEPTGQAEVYLVLSPEELAQGYVRPFRESYRHLVCGSVTTMGRDIAATYARTPTFYGSTYCCNCRKHLPVGEHGQFVWLDGAKVGT